MPNDKGISLDNLFSEIKDLLSHSFNPVHPGSLAHLDPPPLIVSILGDLVAASLNNNLLAYELSPNITLLEESLCMWFSKKIGLNARSIYIEEIDVLESKFDGESDGDLK